MNNSEDYLVVNESSDRENQFTYSIPNYKVLS